ncbi:ROK family protein [Actinotalea sp.]|uniref:ROK family protein n=1 Tax=Actinotalea sp. TaxID=1872145 RepID=UPI002B8729C9|nr:ROK family protein [Actinotalea sp.]HRA49429.1 ROK family protein [Actinotalea sp.]
MSATAVERGPEREPGPRVGVDVGGTKVLAVLLDGADVRAQARLDSVPGPDGVVGAVATAVRQVCVAAGVPLAGLDGVGVGIPGLVDPSAGVVAHAVNLGIVEPLPLAARLGADLGVPVVVGNDLNVAALGAARLLGLGGDLALLALGTGLAAGLVLDGVLRRGASGAAGEIGHVTYRPDGPACSCGQRGCLELYASGSALDAAWPSRSGRPAPVELFAAAAAGDPAAEAVRDAFADAVAAAVLVLVLSTDVEHVVLGGGVAALGAELVAAVRAALARRAATSPFLRSLALADRVAVVPAGLPVGPVGAALAVRPRTRTPETSWKS